MKRILTCLKNQISEALFVKYISAAIKDRKKVIVIIKRIKGLQWRKYNHVARLKETSCRKKFFKWIPRQNKGSTDRPPGPGPDTLRGIPQNCTTRAQNQRH